SRKSLKSHSGWSRRSVAARTHALRETVIARSPRNSWTASTSAPSASRSTRRAGLVTPAGGGRATSVLLAIVVRVFVGIRLPDDRFDQAARGKALGLARLVVPRPDAAGPAAAGGPRRRRRAGVVT